MKNLLVIDDSKTILEALKFTVQKSGKFNGLYARNYAEAAELLQHNKFFAAIVDLELPDCNTAEAVDLTVSYGIPTIALTGGMNDRVRNKILEKPIVDYLIKDGRGAFTDAVYLAENLLLFEREKVLIVDDSRSARAVIGDFLKTLTFSVVEAGSAEEALEILSADSDFCAILIDYELPNMNGLELLQELRGLDFKRRPVTIGITSHEELNVRYGLLKAGANDVFLKPFVKEEFNAKLANALRLAKSQTKLQEYIDMVEKFVMIIDANEQGYISSVSGALCSVSGYEPQDLVGKSFDKFIGDIQDISEIIKTLRLSGGFCTEVKTYKKNGQSYWVAIDFEPVIDKDDGFMGFRAIFQDITATKYAQKLAATDKLTGIYNRHRLEEEFAKSIQNAKEKNEIFSLILIDVDYFKKVNDTFGHQVGDKVLSEVASILQENARKTDIVGRWGGEEFAVIVNNVGLSSAVNLAQKLRVAVARHDFGIAGNLSASFGVSAYCDGDTYGSLFSRADEALYLAKERGRNTVVEQT